VIQDAGKITAVELSPAEPNMFVGKLSAATQSGGFAASATIMPRAMADMAIPVSTPT
jgi:hypothetical protein